MKQVLVLIILLLIVCSVRAETPNRGLLVNPEEVLVIAVHPIPSMQFPYFTPSSLQKALPHFRRGEPKMRLGINRLWQSGVIVLKNKDVLFWRTAHEKFIIVDMKTGQQSFIIGDGNVDL